MSSNKRSERLLNRRQFVGGSAMLIASTAACRVTAGSHEAARLSEDDPSAVALKYVHDAAQADASQRGEKELCSNCQLYKGSDGAEWGPCAIFPGKEVAAKGWCTAWVASSG